MDFASLKTRLTATPRRRLGLKIAAVLAGLWVLVSLFVWLAGPGLLKDYATQFVRDEFGHELAIREVRLNPVLLSLTIDDLDFREPSGSSLLSFRQLVVDVDIQTLVRAMVVLDELRLDGLVVNVERTGPDRFNFSALADRLAERAAAAPGTEPPPAAAEGPAVNFLIRHTVLNEAAFHFVDHTHRPVFENWLRPINLAMDDLTSRPEREAPYDIKAAIGSGGTIGWRGDLSLQPLRSQGRLELREFGLKTAYEYVQSQFSFALPSGTASVRIDYLADFSGTQSVLQVTDGEASIDGLAITAPDGAPIFAFDQTQATGIVADLMRSTLTVNLVETRGGRIEAVVERDGSTNIQRALLPPTGTPVAVAPAPQPEPAAAPTATAPEPAPAWNINVARAAIRDYALHLVDRSTTPAADIQVNGVTFEVRNLRLPEPVPLPFSLEAALAAGGTLGLEGEYVLDSGAVKADVVAVGLALSPFSPYLAGVGRLSLTDGRLNWQGKVSAQANGTKDLRVDGSGSLKQLAVRDDVHKTKLLRLGELGFDGLQYEDRIPRLALRRLTLAGLDVDVTLDKDGVSNLQHVFGGDAAVAAAAGDAPPPAAPAAAPAGRPMSVRLDSFVLRDNTVNFRDASPDLSFAAQLSGFGGRIDGLSSDPARRATVELAGTIDKYAPLTVSGEINPLAAETYSDIKVRLTSLDLGALTPYTVTYIAYPLERGKLGIELDWKVAERKFDAQNRLLLDGLTLGEKREAPRATKLPVKLGIALLTDREGDADLAVPAYGELDDPKFRVGKVILTALTNLVTKAVTSPFAALGNLGGDEKAGQVAYAPGAAQPLAGESEKLVKIAEALLARPMLSLAITGTASADSDRTALQRAALELRLKREYLDSPFRRSQNPDDVRLSPAQRADALRALYREATGNSIDDLRDAQGNPLTESAWQTAAENALLAGIAIDDGALRELARVRAQFAKDRLLAAGVPEASLFVVDGEILPKQDGVAADAPVATRLALDAK
ncbi:MAG: DUF748 domain-containing protein [Pseudomonadota bacterium]